MVDLPLSKCNLPRVIAPGILWVGGCLVVERRGHEVHGHSSAYLIKGSVASLLVDTGSPQDWDQVLAGIEAYLDGRPLDYIFPTHTELPHSGNLPRLMARYPRALAIGDVRDYHLYYPAFRERLQRFEVGAEVDLGGGYRFTIIDAVIRDLPNTQWGYESSQQVLFVADGYSYTHDGEDGEDALHRPGECGLMTSELMGPPSDEKAAFFTGKALYWSRYVDNSTALFGRFEELLQLHPTRMLAPGHGNVVDRIELVTPVIRRSHELAYAEQTKRDLAPSRK